MSDRAPPPLKTTLHADMLGAFVQVAECLSVSAAARDLECSKSQISKRIGQLEQALGATLFSRSTRKVALTPAGEAYLDHAQRALQALRSGEERLRALRSELTGRIRITSTVSWGQRVLSSCLPEFLRLHPALEVDVMMTDRVLDLAREGIDVGLRWSSISHPEFKAVPVARVEWLLAATPDFLERSGTPVHPRELPDLQCLYYWREPSDDRWQLAEKATPPEGGLRTVQDIRVHSRYRVDNPEAVFEATLAGLGIGLLPSYLCAQALRQGSLVEVLPDWLPLTKFGTHISAVVPPERLLLARNQVLVTFLRERLMT